MIIASVNPCPTVCCALYFVTRHHSQHNSLQHGQMHKCPHQAPLGSATHEPTPIASKVPYQLSIAQCFPQGLLNQDLEEWLLIKQYAASLSCGSVCPSLGALPSAAIHMGRRVLSSNIYQHAYWESIDVAKFFFCVGCVSFFFSFFLFLASQDSKFRVTASVSGGQSTSCFEIGVLTCIYTVLSNCSLICQAQEAAGSNWVPIVSSRCNLLRKKG